MSPFDELVAINLGDIYDSLGVKRSSVLDAVFRLPARRFARQMLAFDARVGRQGLHSGAQWARDQFVGRSIVTGTEHIPAAGPVLLISNHPGLSDTINLFAAIPRDDLRIVAAHRPFLTALTHLSAHMVYVKADASDRMMAFRDTLRELKANRVVLTFPAGKIEPDPGIRPADARASIQNWISSIALLAKLTPAAQIVPVIVRGVFDSGAYRNPIAQRRTTLADRERVAAMMQVMWPAYQRNTVTVTFGPALSASALVENAAGEIDGIMTAIRTAARALV